MVQDFFHPQYHKPYPTIAKHISYQALLQDTCRSAHRSRFAAGALRCSSRSRCLMDFRCCPKCWADSSRNLGLIWVYIWVYMDLFTYIYIEIYIHIEIYIYMGHIMDNTAYNGRHHLVWLHHTWNIYQNLPPTYMENVCGNPAPTK